ncbi:MAG: ribose-5-phosphate isomerase RpiA [Gemmatimonadetes bacterium]|nr:ribose-5-phosphate isomerase RpiA [Gemmatimonadota bacterium]
MVVPRSESDIEVLKRNAALEAADRVHEGMVIGLGTGSTVAHFLEILGERIRARALRDVVGIPTSERTAANARRVGVPLATLEDEPVLDLTVDGADEVDPHLNMIKGMGGALLREKIVACASNYLLIIADERKLVSRLGTRSPLPVEVIPFGWPLHLTFLDTLGAQPVLRTWNHGEAFHTDNGHYILDCRFPAGIADPAKVERSLRDRVGIVESGLFLGLADEVIIAGGEGVRTLVAAKGTA